MAVFLQATASGCISGLSPDGSFGGAVRHTEGTLQQSFLSAKYRFKGIQVCLVLTISHCIK